MKAKTYIGNYCFEEEIDSPSTESIQPTRGFEKYNKIFNFDTENTSIKIQNDHDNYEAFTDTIDHKTVVTITDDDTGEVVDNYEVEQPNEFDWEF